MTTKDGNDCGTPFLRDLVARLATPEWFLELAPQLAVSEKPLAAVRPVPEPLCELFDEQAISRFDCDGYFSCERLFAAEECARLAQAIRALTSVDMPASLVYVYDDIWNLLGRIVVAVSQLTNAAYSPRPDIWAWHLRSGHDHSGWLPHRGTCDHAYLALGQRQPLYVNVWIPLVDVSERNACMWIVPLSRDWDYPHALHSRRAVDEGVAFPAPAGSLLGWDSNLLHWGGRMATTPGGERIAVSFTLSRNDASAASNRVPTAGYAFHQRLELVADMLDTYAPMTDTDQREIARALRLAAGMHRLLPA